MRRAGSGCRVTTIAGTALRLFRPTLLLVPSYGSEMKRSQVFFTLAMLAILALAAGLRLPQLDLRPMHADEANQAVKTAQLYETGKYEYDTTDHHGPSLYWLTLPSLAVSGVQGLADSREAQYRIVPALFGIGLIALLLLLTDGLGRMAVVAAGLLMSTSVPLRSAM